MSMKQNLLNAIKMTRPGKSMFDLSHDVKLSMNMGLLVPVMCTECVPTDKFKIGSQTLFRFSPLVAPVMHRMDATVHYFFVPHRLTWENWEDFITNDPSAPAFPTITIDGTTFTDLADYAGIPNPLPGESEVVSALPFAAYQMIYNEYYRDQNLVNAVDFQLVDGDNTANIDLLTMRRRAWEHDYFTAALPFAQKGAAVEIPIGSFEDVKVKGNQNVLPLAANYEWDVSPGGIGAPTPLIMEGGIPDAGAGTSPIYAETSALIPQATTINDLRAAFRLQEWLEKNARAGTRYTENILGHFGLKSPDARLQRPEYITGVKTPIQISEVLNTAGAENAPPQGNMAGHGVAFSKGNYGEYFCQEHGYIIGIMSIMPKTAYQQGLPKHFLKNDFLDFYWPSFAHLGEQPVLNKEVYAYQGTAGDDTFGYVPRYAEYKFEQSRVAGDFRTTLDFWHLSRIFAAPPTLNESFIECNPDDRIFAVTDPNEQKIYVHHYNMVSALRPMPKFGTPMF